LDRAAPLRWLRLGWQDLRLAPGPTAVFGLCTVLVSAMVSALAWQLGRFALLAALTFAATAFSLPMIADRDVDMVTACVSSLNAVLHNKRVMLWWAVLICVLTVVGFATALLGLAVIMPWLAYAAWHGYRETLDASSWPPLGMDDR
jgi:uncharacterized membrane protein